MRALRGAIPRAFRRHNTPEAFAYGRYTRAKLGQLGALPPSAMPTLKLAGVLSVEIDQVTEELQNVRLPRAEKRRLRRHLVILRSQFLSTEKRLDELAKANGHGPAAALAEFRKTWVTPVRPTVDPDASDG